MNYEKLVVYRISKNGPGVGKRLAKALDCPIVTSQTSNIPNNCLVFNYGRSALPNFHDQLASINTINNYLNWPGNVKFAVNKLTTLRKLKMNGIDCLVGTTSKEKAIEWMSNGILVIGRKILNGKKGNGIVYLEVPNNYDEVPDCPLYTQLFPKTHEFRVHVFKGKVIDFQQKKKMSKIKLEKLGLQKANMLIRNNKRGWVFAHNNLVCNSQDKNSIEQLAIEGTKALGLDYAGVDILTIFSGVSKETPVGCLEEAVICEINSAPGMKCTQTFNAYVEAIKKAQAGLI